MKSLFTTPKALAVNMYETEGENGIY